MTPAINELDAAGVPYGVHEYGHGGSLRDFGLEAAEQLGVDPDQVFKTLLVDAGDGLFVAVVPVSRRLAPKALASVFGVKRLELADPDTAERVTGFVRGGISPFGQKRRLPTALDETARMFDEIFVSGGKRGLDVSVAPDDLVRILDAVVGDISG